MSREDEDFVNSICYYCIHDPESCGHFKSFSKMLDCDYCEEEDDILEDDILEDDILEDDILEDDILEDELDDDAFIEDIDPEAIPEHPDYKDYEY